MGNQYSKEKSESWQDPDVQSWIASAAVAMKSDYCSFQGAQWEEYAPEELNIFKAKICFALFGNPGPCLAIQSSKDELWNTHNTGDELFWAYSGERQAAATEIFEKMYDVFWHSSENCQCHADSTVSKFRVFIIFIYCKMEEFEFRRPIFRISTSDEDLYKCKYVDVDLRVYPDWEDWRKYNKLPMMKYAIPKNGFYSCRENGYEFDENKDPCLIYEASPACKFESKLARTTDGVAAVGSLVTGGLMIASMFTPLAPATLAACAVAGGGAGVYGTARSAIRLVDKGNHGESLTDKESLTCWLSMGVMPLSFATAAVNGTIVNGARSAGRIFSSTERMTATFLNLTTFGFQNGLMIMGLTNLIEKAQNKSLSTLDVLQFSMSLFFFTNTLIQPKTASAIIDHAQNEYIQEYKSKMNDGEVQRTFQRFVDQNGKGDGIKAQARIIRTINRIKDPEAVFKGVAEFDNIQIGRRGKFLRVSNKNDVLPQTKIYPNRMIFPKPAPTPHPQNVLKTAFGEKYQEIKVNGKQIFENLSDHEVARIHKVLSNEGRDYNQGIIHRATDLANELKCNNVSDFLAVVDLIAIECRGMEDAALQSKLAALGTGGQDRALFINGIQKDIHMANEISANADRVFGSPLKAVEHCRKHGMEFVRNENAPQIMHVYLKEIPGQIFMDKHIITVARKQTSVVKQFYNPSNKHFGVLIEGVDGKPVIATVFKRDLTMPAPTAEAYCSLPDASKGYIADYFARNSIIANLTVKADENFSCTENENVKNIAEILVNMFKDFSNDCAA